MQPSSTATRVYKVQQTKIQPVRIHSSSHHVGHSNHGFVPEHTPLPTPTLPSIPDFPIHKPSVDINPNDQIVSTQITVSSIGTPTHELEMETSQVVVDSSIKTEWKKPEGDVIEIMPTVEGSPMTLTSVAVGESHVESSKVVVDTLTKTSEWNSEHEHFDKTIIDKKSEIIVSSSSGNGNNNLDNNNQIVSTQTTETAATAVVSMTKNEIVGVPILPIETAPKPVGDGQFGSSQIVVESSTKSELSKTEGVEIIPSAPIQTIINESSQQQSQIVLSTQTITSSTVTKTETFGQHSTQMTSSTPATVVYQSTSGVTPNIDSQISQIVTSIIANECVFGKKTIDPVPSTSTTMHVTEVHHVIPNTVHVNEVHQIAPSTVQVNEVHQIAPSTVHVTEVHEVGPERIMPSVDDEISEAFKDFVGGLMSTTPEARKIEPIFPNQPLEVTVVTAEAPAFMPVDVTVATTIEAAKDIISNEMAPSTSIQSDANAVEVIESIPSVVEVVTTQPTSTGYEETKVIATKFTSDGPTFLEVSKTGFHTDGVATSSATELQSTQVVSKSTFSYEDDQLISATTVPSDSVLAEKMETSVIQTSSSEQTFTSFTEFSSSSSTHVVSSTEQQESFRITESSSPDYEDGPTIVEVSSTSVEPSSPPTATTYVVSEPTYEDRSSSPAADYRSNSPANDYGGSSYSYDDSNDYSCSYDDD